MSKRRRRFECGFTLLEILVVVSIISVLALIIVARISVPGRTAKVNACHVNCGNIETQAQLWFRNKGSWPANDLADIGTDVSYFPEGVATCPVDGSAYTFDGTTEEVVGHDH